MDQDPFTASLFKWDPRSTLGVASGVAPPSQPPAAPPQLPPYLARGILAGMRDPVGLAGPAMGMGMGMGMGNSSNSSNGSGNGGGGLEELFQPYGIRYYTAAKIAEMGFTVSTLVDMKDEELDDMMNSLSHIFRWDLLVGERYGIKAAVRAERRRLEELEESRRHGGGHHLMVNFSGTPPPESGHGQHPLDALSQEGLSEEQGVQEKEVVGSGGGGGGNWDMTMAATTGHHLHRLHHHPNHQQPPRKKQLRKQGGRKGTTPTSHHNNNNAITLNSKKGQASRVCVNNNDDEMEDEDEVDDDDETGRSSGERQREHPFIVTEPGEVARGKKNGLDYLFHLYEQCREFLVQVQNIAKERGEKCPTKVTNQVFRYANKAGATYINKPKMRHYVHCYALHCLDEETSNALRRAFKERGENVGAWRQACYKPLVAIAARQGWDIDAIFNSHPRLSIWYVPTKLRQLCHAERSGSTAAAVGISPAPGSSHHHLHFSINVLTHQQRHMSELCIVFPSYICSCVGAIN